jgi:hypothetical protein
VRADKAYVNNSKAFEITAEQKKASFGAQFASIYFNRLGKMAVSCVCTKREGKVVWVRHGDDCLPHDLKCILPWSNISYRTHVLSSLSLIT